METGGQRENVRYKQDQYRGVHTQWMIPSQLMKDPHALSMKFMTILSERDAALQQRDLALSEKKAALAERDAAILQRDTAVLQRDTALAERNSALIERDNIIVAFEYRENATMSGSSSPTCPERFGSSHEARQMHRSQHGQHPTNLAEVPYHTREMHFTDALPISQAASDVGKPLRNKRPKCTKPMCKRTSKSSRKGRTMADDLNMQLTVAEPLEWKNNHGMGGCSEDLNKELVSPNEEWKDQDTGLNQVLFDDSSMPVPVCSCTGVLQQCYKWGSGGWQSACCTTTISMHPLPMMPNKRRVRVSGRKMSASAFTKLVSRLEAEGYDRSVPLDLKEHWAKHGTNRYITIR